MEKIKLPRSSYDELVKIIIAYGSSKKPSRINDIAQATGMGVTNVSANNNFLAFIDIIQGGHKKSITPKGANLAQSLDHDMLNDMKKYWTEIVNENDFLTKMLQAVKVRKGMDISQLENHIAFSSGEKKSGFVLTGARAVIDILVASSQLSQDGDKLVYNKLTSLEVIDDTEVDDEKATMVLLKDQQIQKITYQGGVSINIELRINASPKELEGLGEKIKKIIDDLKED